MSDDLHRNQATTPILLRQLRQLIEEEDAKIVSGVDDEDEPEESNNLSEQKDEERPKTPPLSEEIEMIPKKLLRNTLQLKSKRWTLQTLQAQKSVAETELNRLINTNEGKIIHERVQVLQEIMDSERTYVQFLELLYRMYYAPICENAPDLYKRDDNDTHGVDASSRDSMFPPNLATILNFNRAFMERLEERKQQYEDLLYFVTIGDIYAEMAPFLKVYVSYVTHYDRSVKSIRKNRKKNAQFDQWLDRRKRHPDSNGLDITSLMVMPVQKLPRHKILLQALLAKTDKEHADYSLLQEAHDAVSIVAEFQNTKIRDTKNSNRVYQLSKKLRLKELVSPSRRIVREGVVQVKNISRKCYLFNDLIVIEQEQRSIGDAPEVYSLLDSFIAGGDEHSVVVRIDSTISVSLQCESNDEKQKWHDAIFRVLCDLNERENDEVIRHVDDPNGLMIAKRHRSNPLGRLNLPVTRLRDFDLSLPSPRGSGDSPSQNKRLSLQFHKIHGTNLLFPRIITTPTLDENPLKEH
jgi:hypothetical protein